MLGDKGQRAISHEHIIAAETLIDPVFRGTPVITHPGLDRELGARLILKDETANPIGSFKGRGAEHFAATRDLSGCELVCASAGNFGQGLARAGVKRGATVKVFVSTAANPFKIARMRELGAAITVAGEDFDAANAAAKAYAAANRLDYVEDASYPEIAEGAGTLAKELTDAGHRPDVFFVPVGGAALANGVGCWLKHAAPGCEVVGVVAEGAPAYKLSFEAGRVIETETANTIADGIAIRAPVAVSLAAMRLTIDRLVVVSDAEILAALKLLHATTGVFVETAGAAGIAAALRYREAYAGKLVATVLCGGNLTPEQKREWLGV